MAKLICFPFFNGDLANWVPSNLSDEDRERVYKGEKVSTKWGSGEVIWKPNAEVELSLTYSDYGRGRSSVLFYWKDENNHEYPMFITDVDKLIRQNIGIFKIHAIFTYVKRGANYGIKFLRKVE